MRDLHNNINAAVAYNVAALSTAATTNGNVVDRAAVDCESLDFQAFTGEWSAGSFTLALYESDDNSTYTAVAASDLIGDPTAAVLDAANSVVRLGYIGSKRYIRPSIVAAGGTVSATVGALVQYGNLAAAPSDTFYGSEA